MIGESPNTVLRLSLECRSPTLIPVTAIDVQHVTASGMYQRRRRSSNAAIKAPPPNTKSQYGVAPRVRNGSSAATYVKGSAARIASDTNSNSTRGTRRKTRTQPTKPNASTSTRTTKTLATGVSIRSRNWASASASTSLLRRSEAEPSVAARVIARPLIVFSSRGVPARRGECWGNVDDRDEAGAAESSPTPAHPDACQARTAKTVRRAGSPVGDDGATRTTASTVRTDRSRRPTKWSVRARADVIIDARFCSFTRDR